MAFFLVNTTGKWRMNFHNIFRKFCFFLFMFWCRIFPAYTFMYSAWWPFLTWLSCRAQSDRRTCYWETSVVHQIRYSFSYFLFTYVLFIHFILDKINGTLYPVEQLDHLLGKWHSHFSVLPHTTLTCDCFHTALLVCVIYLQLFRHLNLSPYNPSYLSSAVLSICGQIKPITYGHEPSITDTSKRKKQIFQKCSATV